MNWLSRIVVIWLIGTTAHVPFPVCDVDLAASGQLTSLQFIVGDLAFDLDFVLLGADLPDDYDDGPLDIDPETGSVFGFGVPISTKSNANLLRLRLSQRQDQKYSRLLPDKDKRKLVPDILVPPFTAFLNLSFGKLSQSGIAHLHC